MWNISGRYLGKDRFVRKPGKLPYKPWTRHVFPVLFLMLLLFFVFFLGTFLIDLWRIYRALN